VRSVQTPLRRLFAAQPIDQRSQIANRVSEMLGSLPFNGCMLAYQVVEHGLKASEPGEMEISHSRHTVR
jgi:hypothetical protein